MVPEAVFMIVFIGLFGPSCVSLYSFFFSQENKYIDHLNMMLLQETFGGQKLKLAT